VLQDSAGPDGSQTRSNMLGGRLSRPVAALAKQTAHAMTAVTASTRAPALAPRLRSRGCGRTPRASRAQSFSRAVAVCARVAIPPRPRAHRPCRAAGRRAGRAACDECTVCLLWPQARGVAGGCGRLGRQQSFHSTAFRAEVVSALLPAMPCARWCPVFHVRVCPGRAGAWSCALHPCSLRVRLGLRLPASLVRA